MNAKIYQRHRLKFNMFMMMVIVVITVISLVGIAINRAFVNVSRSRLETSYQQLIEERGRIMSATIDNIYKLCDDVASNDLIYEALVNYDELSDIELLNVHREIESVIASKYHFLNSINSINIVTADKSLLFDAGYDVSNVQYIPQIMADAEESGERIVWSYIKEAGKKKTNYITLTRAVNYRFRTERVGYLILTISENYFRSLFSDLYLGENALLLVLDHENQIVSSTVAEEEYSIGSKLSFSVPEEDIVWEPGRFFSVELQNGERYTAVHSEIVETDWRLVGMVADSYLDDESSTFLKMVILAAILAFLCIILVFLALSGSIFKPLDALVNHMSRADGTDLQIFPVTGRPGEIETLACAYNAQIERISDLIDEIKENEKNKNEMKLQLLQAQINPHFLFNTLDSLKWVALMSHCSNVAEGINALSELLRSAISKTEYVTLEEEIHNIQNYITIMKIRFNEFFDLRIDLPHEMQHFYILKMLLQPMVENAIIHGISGLQRKGEITIRFWTISGEKKIGIEIRDNGVGFDEETIVQERKDRVQKSFHIGMDNVAERIAIYYGNEYGYVIRSVTGEGTAVTFTLPLLEKEVIPDVQGDGSR